MSDQVTTRWTVVRAGILRVGKPAISPSFSMDIGGVKVQTRESFAKDGEAMGVLTLARMEISGWDHSTRPLLLPDAARDRLELALQVGCRMLALDRRVEHEIVSPRPCFGLICSDPGLMTELDGITVEHPWPQFPMVGTGPAGLLDEPRALGHLEDRIDGLILATEALNSGSALGEFIQVWRFFERAFKAGHSDALPHLQAFLSSGAWHGFTPDEVERWFDVRNPSVHANRDHAIVLESDVLLFRGRMREAMYDVLLNKRNWWQKDSERREAWKPASGSGGPAGDVFVTQGKDVNLQASFTDEFGSFPFAMSGPFEPHLPKALWLQADAEGAQLTRSGSGAPLT